MRNPLRQVLDALDALDAHNRAKVAAEGWRFHNPTICEAWLDDRRKVQWLQERLRKAGLSRRAGHNDQQIGQTFCSVIQAWGEDLVEQKLPNPQSIMIDSDFTSWQAAMRKYPWQA